jgi:glycosyltransferase involved in cell wall biosynthesis
MTVDVLMAVFDGERHLEEQAASILGQEGADLVLVARDDGSTDGSADILVRLARAHPGRVRIEPGGAHLGAAAGFGALLQGSQADYSFFSDQDDVWLPGKVQATLQALRDLEARHGVDVPLLVHSDLRVVDARLQPIAESFWAHHRLDPAHDARLDRLLVRNVVTGSTVAVNRALRARAGAIPPEAAMHDWWLALVAAAFGHTGRVGQPTVLYRQHDANQIGARPAGVGEGVRAAARGRVGRYYRRTRAQARAFRDRYRDQLEPRARAIVDAYAGLEERGPIARRAGLLRHGFREEGLLRNLALLAFF